MFEAFKIAVRISVINDASLGLANLSRDFMKASGHGLMLEKQIALIQKQAAKGTAMFGFGAALAGSLKAPYEEAKKLSMAQEKFQTLNLSQVDNMKVFAAAQTLAHKQLGSTITENIHLIQDLHTAIGSVDHALDLAPLYQKFSAAAKIQNDGKSVDSLVMNSIKALEHRGDKVTQNHDAMLSELAMQSQVYFATNGRVNPSDYFHASQTGKIAYQLADKEFLYGPLAAIIQQKSGPTAGTALMTMDSSLIGGHMDNKAKGFLAELGLWTTTVSPIQKQINEALKSMPAAERKALGITNIAATQGGLRADAADLVARRPDEFVKNILVPAMQAKFGANISTQDMALLLAKHFNRSTADFLGTLITSQGKIAKDTAIINRAQDFRGAYGQYLKSSGGAEVAADAAWKNFLAVFGSVYLPTITNGLLKLAGGLDALAQTVERHPLPFKIVTTGLIGLAAAMTFGGMVNLLSAAMRGLGVAMLLNAAGGYTGIAKIAMSIGGAGASSLAGALGLVLSPIGLAVAALGTLALAAYAFRPLSQKEIDSYKTDGGVKLSAGVQARIDAGELAQGRPPAIASARLLQFAQKQSPELDQSGPHASPSIRTRADAAKGGKVGDVHIDGKKAGELIAPHIAKSASAPSNSNTFDFTAGLATPGMAY